MLRVLAASAMMAAALSPGIAVARGGTSGGGGHSSGSYGHYSGTGSSSSSHYTQGYTTNRGTYVAPHYATNPNSTRTDNYEAKGNYNPHTGTYGSTYVDR